MPIRKLRRLDGDDTVGVSIDKEELREEGIIDGDEFQGPEHVEVTKIDDGEWRVRRLSDLLETK